MNLITLPENIIPVINVVLIGLFVVLALIGYLRGFLSQVYDLVVMLIGYLLALLIAPSLAASVKLVPASVNFDEIPFVGAQIVTILDTILWTILIVIIISIIGFIFKGLFFKKLLHYKKKVIADRIGGAVFAILPVFLIGFLTALILSAPIFSNGSTLLSATVLSPLAPSTQGIVNNFVENNPVISLYEKISSGQELDETDFDAIRQTLVDMGFPQNVIDVAMKFVRHETITEADLLVLKTYAQDNNITAETIRGWLTDFGFTEAQINELMAQYSQP